MPQDTLEYPLQRDEVQTIQSKGERNFVPQSMFYFLLYTYKCEKGFITAIHSSLTIFFINGTSVISPKPIDQEPEQHFVGVIIAILTTIILLLIAVILFIVARNKRSRRSEALNSLQFNFNQDTLGLGIDKRMNSNMKVIVQNHFNCNKIFNFETRTFNVYWFY